MDPRDSHYPRRRASSRARLFKRHPFTLPSPRLPPGDEPPTTDNPAWLLSDDAAPVELAPWSSLEVATSPACADKSGYRAIVQTGKSWLSVDGASGFRPQTGMTALVRWSTERVCLEAVEVGFSELKEA